MRRRAVFALIVLVVIGALVAAFVIFPTRYKCNGDDLTFTTSKTFAEQVCATGVTGGVVADQRIEPRIAVLAVVAMVVLLLLRLGSSDADVSSAGRR